MEKYRTEAINKSMKSLQGELDFVESQRKSMVTVPMRQKEREKDQQPMKKALQPQEQIPPEPSGQEILKPMPASVDPKPGSLPFPSWLRDMQVVLPEKSVVQPVEEGILRVKLPEPVFPPVEMTSQAFKPPMPLQGACHWWVHHQRQ